MSCALSVGSFGGDAWMASTSSHSAAQYALEASEGTTFLDMAQQPMLEPARESLQVPARPSMRRLQQSSGSCLGNTFKVVQVRAPYKCNGAPSSSISRLL